MIQTQLTALSLVSTTPVNGGNVTVTLDPSHLADDTGTMSFVVTTPTAPGTLIGGTITDSLNVFFQANVPGVGPVFGHEDFMSSGTWQAFLPIGSSTVTGFRVLVDNHTAPGAEHTVSSVPEPSTWLAWAMVGLVAPLYARWRRRRV
jgi:hypothetical protein